MQSVECSSPKENHLLSSLSFHEYVRLHDDFEMVRFNLGDVIYNSGDSLRWVYFPTTCIVSLVFSTQNGSSAELAMTGNDGLVGLPLVLGGDTTTHHAVVQSAGIAYRLRAEIMQWELDQGGEIHRLTLRYTQALMTQMAQSVVCNRHHSVDQQLCRWLLLSFDRLVGNQLCMTQELIANMLGVRREAITEAAGKLQTAGLITYSRGKITLLDRLRLEGRVCECYAVVKAEYERLFQLNDSTRDCARPRPYPASLRTRAEARFRHCPTEVNLSQWEKSALIHELEVHQIELEIQNEELSKAYDETDALRARYADIYDFSPVGYFTLDKSGNLLELNMAGAILLGIKRSEKRRYRFDAFIAPHYLPTFSDFSAEVLVSKTRTVCEIGLSATAKRGEVFVRIEAVTDENRAECRMIVMDVTEQRHNTLLLERSERRHRTFVEKLPLSIAIVQDGLVQFINPKCSEVTGFTLEECVGKPYLQFIHPSDQQLVVDDYEHKRCHELHHACCEVRVAAKAGGHIYSRLYMSTVDWNDQPATLVVLEDVTVYNKLQAELRQLAITDYLTNLSTRRHFIARCEEELSRLKRGIEQTVSVVMLDIDHFKLVNDRLGHAGGDAVLRFFAKKLTEEIRTVDLAGRIGGEEFAVLLPDTTQAETVIFAERFRRSLADSSILVDGCEVSITVSIGIASMTSKDQSSDQALIRADHALYRAKAAGRNRVEECVVYELQYPEITKESC